MSKKKREMAFRARGTTQPAPQVIAQVSAALSGLSPVVVGSGDALLLSGGDYLLLTSGDKILLS